VTCWAGRTQCQAFGPGGDNWLMKQSGEGGRGGRWHMATITLHNARSSCGGKRTRRTAICHLCAWTANARGAWRKHRIRHMAVNLRNVAGAESILKSGNSGGIIRVGRGLARRDVVKLGRLSVTMGWSANGVNHMARRARRQLVTRRGGSVRSPAGVCSLRFSVQTGCCEREAPCHW